MCVKVFFVLFLGNIAAMQDTFLKTDENWPQNVTLLKQIES